MAVNAIDVASVTVNPTKVRYSFGLDHLGDVNDGWLALQRSDKREDGTWMDDPHPNSFIYVPLPIDSAVDNVAALIPVLLAKKGITDTFTNYRLEALSKLSVDGILDVIIIIQLYTDHWITKNIPSLTEFLGLYQDIALQVLSAWDALDVSIDAANAREKWI